MTTSAPVSASRFPESVLLPGSAAEFTPGFLSSALSAWHPGTVVEEVEVAAPVHGTATKVGLSLKYRGNPGLPERLVVKAGWEPHSDMVAAQYRAEATFYARLAVGIRSTIPRCYFAGIDPVSRLAMVVLEDLNDRGVTFGDPTRPLDVDHLAQVLEMQAGYHATYWGSDLLAEEWLKGSHAESSFRNDMVTEAHWTRHLQLPRAQYLAEPHRDRIRMAESVRRLYLITDHPDVPCLIHADPHLGNLFFETDGGPGFLDWQSPQRGHWAHDVTYTLIGSLSVADRRRSEVQLVEHYLAALAGQGVAAPSFDQAWTAYRQHALYGVMWSMCPPEMQIEPNVVAMTERFSAAAEDLDSLSIV
jgi:hypothetical protein